LVPIAGVYTERERITPGVDALNSLEPIIAKNWLSPLYYRRAPSAHAVRVTPFRGRGR
jgi:hypothetical protein